MEPFMSCSSSRPPRKSTATVVPRPLPTIGGFSAFRPQRDVRRRTSVRFRTLESHGEARIGVLIWHWPETPPLTLDHRNLDDILGDILRGAAKILGCSSTTLILINENS